MSWSPAPDQTERAILQDAYEDGTGCPCDLIVLEDATGTLTAQALEIVAEHEAARVLSWTASARRAGALRERLSRHPLHARLLLPSGPEPWPLQEAAATLDAHTALARLPRSLAELEDRARRLGVTALSAGREDVTLIAGGRVKHMTRSQNEVLARVFTEVTAGRGVGKSRALRGAGVRPGLALPEPAAGHADVRVRGESSRTPLRGIGGAFGGAKPDAGSLLLLNALDAALVGGEVPEVSAAVDLGCGTGLLTQWLARALPTAQVLGSDDAADAIASTRAGLEAAGLAEDARIRLSWDDALSREAADSADLVLLNPPFHEGTAIDPTLVQGLLDAAARVLRPGGELWMVHNSHLRYRPEVERRIGPVRERARDRRFTVLSARRR